MIVSENVSKTKLDLSWNKIKLLYNEAVGIQPTFLPLSKVNTIETGRHFKFYYLIYIYTVLHGEGN